VLLLDVRVGSEYVPQDLVGTRRLVFEDVADIESTSDPVEDSLSASWFGEFIAARAGVSREAPGEEVLEEESEIADELGVLPVAAQVGSEEEQEAFEESLSLFTGVGSGGFFSSDDQGGGWF